MGWGRGWGLIDGGASGFWLWRPLRNPSLVARKTLTPTLSQRRPLHNLRDGCPEDPHPNPLPEGEGARAAPFEVEAELRKGLQREREKERGKVLANVSFGCGRRRSVRGAGSLGGVAQLPVVTVMVTVVVAEGLSRVVLAVMVRL